MIHKYIQSLSKQETDNPINSHKKNINSGSSDGDDAKNDGDNESIESS
jgi:hypothetical protein